MVAEKAEKDKKINLKPGRYVRIEADTRLARVDEEYDLLRKFSNFHFSSIVSSGASIDDLNVDLLREYFAKTSSRQISDEMEKKELARALELIDKNDPTDRRVKNYAVLMFSGHPERYIPYAYTELIIDMLGSKRRMESKVFKGAIWKQYYSALDYINSNFLNELVIRVDGNANNRKIANFTFTALEELLANAIVHNNYENGKPIQIYVSEKQINIVNYNKPLPPIRISDLNERTFFNERLHWDKISFEENTLRVAESRVRSSSGVYDKDRVKTESSFRIIRMIEPIASCLKEIRQRQMEKGIYNPHGFVFVWEEDNEYFGQPYNPDYITKLFKKLVKECPYTNDEMHFHHLRHSCCSICREFGFTLAEISALLGHGSESITKEVYDHYEDKIMEDSYKKLSDAFT